MRNRTRVMTAAAVAAALTAGSTAAAVASATGAKPGVHAKIRVHAKTVSASEKPADDSALAARLGVSPARLDQALRAVKTSLSKASAEPTEDRFDAALARSLGISQARVRQAFPVAEPGGSKTAGSKTAGSKTAGSKTAGSKTAGSKTAAQAGNEALAAAVARALHVSTAQVNAALRSLFAAGRADPSSPVFAAAAHALGVSTKQLAAAIASAKQSLAGGS
jgi:hypothetical protein